MKIETVEYTCDLCGKVCNPGTETEQSATIEFHFGYGSKMDSANVNIDLCAKCAEEAFKDISILQKLITEQGKF